MAIYKINLENTGLDNDEQVRAMVNSMQSDGHAVELTRDFGAVNEHAECPASESEWMEYLISASA